MWFPEGSEKIENEILKLNMKTILNVRVKCKNNSTQTYLK